MFRDGLGECPRYEGEHEGPLDWHLMQRPTVESDGTWQYWATCPTTGDPILFQVKDVPTAAGTLAGVYGDAASVGDYIKRERADWEA